MKTVFEPTPHAQKLLTNFEEVSKDSDVLYRMTQVSCLKVGDELSYWLEDLDDTELNGLFVTAIEPVSKTTPNGEPNKWAYMSDAMHVKLVDTNAWREKFAKPSRHTLTDYGSFSDEKIVSLGHCDKRVTISADIIVAVKVVN